jgi:AcrR family transcriptional regulator
MTPPGRTMLATTVKPPQSPAPGERATRLSAAERRADVVDAAVVEFAKTGLVGTSTDDIARRAGISQPYVFRLFGTKKELFEAATERAFREHLELFERVAEGKHGEEALRAIGQALLEEALTEPTSLVGQMHACAACSDPRIRDVVRAGYADLVGCAERVSGLPPERISGFFAAAMTLSLLASMHAQDGAEAWAAMLLEGCAATLTGSEARADSSTA